MDSGTMRLPKELLRSLMSDGGDLGLQFLPKAKACCSPGILGFFGFGAPAWNDSRCPEKAGEGIHAAMVSWVFALRLYSYGFQVHTRFLVFIRDTSHRSSFPEHSFYL